MMAVFEQQFEIQPHASLGNESAPPGASPLIGDRVMHDAFIGPSPLEAVLVNEQDEWTFHDLVHQQIGRLHGLPPTGPVHLDDPPIAAMQFDHAPFQGRAIRFEAHQLQGRGHDLWQVARITVEFEHCLHAGSERGAGMKD